MRSHCVVKYVSIVACLYVSTPLMAADHQDAHTIAVLTYNVFLRSPTWVFWDRHDWRVRHIPARLRGFDAVVLQEAFSNRHRTQIIEAVKDEYPYHSKILGEDEFLKHNGGVIILSRWPILTEAQAEFTVCEGSDCLVKKGVVYTKFEKHGQTYHLFGLHLQAQVEFADTRLAQLPEVRKFIDLQNVPKYEPLLIAGDFNIDYFSNDTDGEYEAAVRVLNIQFDEVEPEASYASATNSLVGATVNERLDYVFFSNDHLKPSSLVSEIVYMREDGEDLSDHHGVVGRLRFVHAQ